MTSMYFKNNARSNVSTTLSAGDTTLVVTTGEGANFPSSFPFLLTIWDAISFPNPGDDSGMEIVRCTGRTTDTLTIVRAQEGTSDVGHAVTERVAMLITAGHFNDDSYGIVTKLDDLAKSATVVVGKSGAVDYLTTDYDSDDACIKAAIDYVSGLGGGTVLIREGAYTIDNPNTVPDNITVAGCGLSTILTLSNGVNDSCFKNSDQSGGNSKICIENLRINGNGSNQTAGTCIHLQRCDDSKLRNLYLEHGYAACLYWSGVTGDNNRNIVDHVICDTNYNATGLGCSTLGRHYNTIIKDSIFRNACEYGGLTIDSCMYTTIQNCLAHDNVRSGFIVEGTESDYKKSHNKVINNVSHSNTGTSASGIHVQEDHKYMQICGNVCYDNDKHGIRCEGLQYSVISGNVCLNNNQGGVAGDGIILAQSSGECEHNLLSENMCIDDQVVHTQTYGIRELNSSDYNTISNNIFSGNVTAAIAKTGNNSIFTNNHGYNPVGNITPPSVPASTVNYTNAYGYPCQVSIYGGVVTDIDLDDVSTGLTTGSFTIPPGGTINITYSVAPSWRWWGL